MTNPQDINLKELEGTFVGIQSCDKDEFTFQEVDELVKKVWKDKNSRFRKEISDKLNRIEIKKRCISSVAFHICSKHPEDCEWVIDEQIIRKEFTLK